MELYQLECVLHEPCKDQGWLYMAETPELPGCRAWGETGSEPWPNCRGGRAIHSLLPGARQASADGNRPLTERAGQDFCSRMTYRELTRKLRRLGCAFERQAGGSHEIWVNPANNQETTIPRHANRDLATGTVHGIRRDLGITRQEFDRA